jgi:hypothetical protein
VRCGLLGIVLLFSLMFGVGWLVLGAWARAAAALVTAVLALLLLRRVNSGRAYDTV